MSIVTGFVIIESTFRNYRIKVFFITQRKPRNPTQMASLAQGRAEVGGSRSLSPEPQQAAPMALQMDKPPRPDLSPEDVRQIVQINAFGIEITVRAPPRRSRVINALGLVPTRALKCG